jgi:hypothetical protein
VIWLFPFLIQRRLNQTSEENISPSNVYDESYLTSSLKNISLIIWVFFDHLKGERCYKMNSNEKDKKNVFIRCSIFELIDDHLLLRISFLFLEDI